MGKSYYTVKIVEKERLSLWHERWPLTGQPTARALEADRDGSLSREEFVQAKNKNEAADLAEKANPGFVAIRSATERR